MPARRTIANFGRKGISTARYLQEFNADVGTLRAIARNSLASGSMDATQTRNIKNLLNRKSMGGSGR